MNQALRWMSAVVVVALVWLPQSGARLSDDSPQDLQGTFNALQGVSSLTWQAPARGNSSFTYPVWRDGTLIGSTMDLAFSDHPPVQPGTYGVVYFVSASPPGNTGSMSWPAVVAVPTTSMCDVATLTVTQSYPYVYVALHEECVGGITYDKNVTWRAPA